MFNLSVDEQQVSSLDSWRYEWSIAILRNIKDVNHHFKSIARRSPLASHCGRHETIMYHARHARAARSLRNDVVVARSGGTAGNKRTGKDDLPALSEHLAQAFPSDAGASTGLM
jgi:hypothetical protein